MRIRKDEYLCDTCKAWNPQPLVVMVTEYGEDMHTCINCLSRMIESGDHND